MFIKITKKTYKGKIYKQASLVETFRKGNKVKQRKIKNLGTIETKEDEIRIQQMVDSAKNGKILFTLNEANEFVCEYGVWYVVSHIWNELGLAKFFRNKKSRIDANDLICLLISHRLHRYGSCNLSEREAHRWITSEAYKQFGKVSLQQVYRLLYFAFNKKQEIEKHLCSTLDIKKEVIFYDLTSSYLEGEYSSSELVEFGYSRDKKRGKEQIVLGLLLSGRLPLGHDIFAGNTPDKTTLNNAIDHAESLGITKFIFVADRGIFTDDNLNYIEGKKLEYIIATQRRTGNLIRQLMQLKTSQPVKKVYYDSVKERTYHLCYNEEVAQFHLNKMEEMKKSLETKLSELKKPDEKNVYSLLGKASKFFKITFKPNYSFTLNQEVWNYEKAIAGKYLLITNNKNLNPEDIQATYKQLADIEQAFGELKHFENIRPIFHKKDDGIKAHVFLCILTLLIERYIQLKIEDLSAREIFAEIKKIKLSKIKEYYVRTEITKTQKQILSKLSIEEPPKII